jgi:hypothetical protein
MGLGETPQPLGVSERRSGRAGVKSLEHGAPHTCSSCPRMRPVWGCEDGWQRPRFGKGMEGLDLCLKGSWAYPQSCQHQWFRTKTSVHKPCPGECACF